MINRLFAFLGRHRCHLLASISALLPAHHLYSASGESGSRVGGQLANIVVALTLMWIAANIPPHYLLRLALPTYLIGLLLIAVAVFEVVLGTAPAACGAITFQPSEVMKVAVPLALAWYFDRYEAVLRLRDFAVAAAMLLMPVVLIAKQPDLGTALIITAAGFYVIFLAGLSWKILVGLTAAIMARLPLLWSVMHDYQRRILTFWTRTGPIGRGLSRSGVRSAGGRLVERDAGARDFLRSAALTSSSPCSLRNSAIRQPGAGDAVPVRDRARLF
jgi:cell division protein FtsW (lipid II flippase)